MNFSRNHFSFHIKEAECHSLQHGKDKMLSIKDVMLQVLVPWLTPERLFTVCQLFAISISPELVFDGTLF